MSEPGPSPDDDTSPATPDSLAPSPSPDVHPPPLVTVLLPVYNGCTPSATSLTNAIHSILSQSLPSLLLLLIDDGSTDSTPTLLSLLLPSDTRLRLLTHPTRMGVAAALNTGLAHTPPASTFIARMDADDVSHPSRLLLQTAYLTRHPHVAVVGTAVDVHSLASAATRTIALPSTPAMAAWSMAFFCSLAHPSVMIRRALLPSLVYSTSPLHAHVEDLQLWLRLLREGHTLTSLPPPPLLTLTRHPQSSSSLHSSHQRHFALHLTLQHLRLTLQHRIRWTALHLLVNPRLITATRQVLQCAALLLLMETRWLRGERDGGKGGEEVEVVEDVTKRLGELVMLAMTLRGAVEQAEEEKEKGYGCGVPGCVWEGESSVAATARYPEVAPLHVDVTGLMGLWLKRGGGAQSQALLHRLLTNT